MKSYPQSCFSVALYLLYFKLWKRNTLIGIFHLFVCPSFGCPWYSPRIVCVCVICKRKCNPSLNVQDKCKGAAQVKYPRPLALCFPASPCSKGTRLDTRPISSCLWVGRGSNAGGQGKYESGWELFCGRAGAVMLRNCKSGQFSVILIFTFQKHRPTFQGTHPPIESLSKLLKVSQAAFLLQLAA